MRVLVVGYLCLSLGLIVGFCLGCGERFWTERYKDALLEALRLLNLHEPHQYDRDIARLEGRER